MSIEPNVIFINGWGGDPTSFTLAALRNRMLAEFGRSVYSPPPVNYKETGLILRYLADWKDPTIFVALSCGCSTINAIAQHAPSGEAIPFAQYYSPSMLCGVGTVPDIIGRVQEVNSWGLDVFNPGSRQLIVPARYNTETIFNPRIKTGLAHGFTPNSIEAQNVLFGEIRKAKGAST